MGGVLKSRRFLLGVLGILALTFIAIYNKIDTSMALASVVASISASNAFERSRTRPDGDNVK